MGLFLDGVERISKESGAHVMLLHHTGKTGDTERGTSALRGFVQTMLKLIGDDEQPPLSCDKQKDGAAPFAPHALAISGGHPCLFGADTLVPGEPAILTEGEFDALLVWQEVGDLLGVATLGSCSRGMSPKALRYLLGWPRLLVAYDVDAEGDKGAERLQRLSGRMQRVRPSVGKDVTAFWQAGGRVRDACGLSWGGSIHNERL